MNKTDIKKAYKGKIVQVKRDKYGMIPEKVDGGCQGCDLIGKVGCSKYLTDLCRQGFIFKKLSADEISKIESRNTGQA